MTLLQHHALALSLTALATLGLGLLVFLAEPKRYLNQIFGLYSLAITGWAVSEIFTLTASAQSIASTWVYYVGWPSVIFIAPTFLHSVLLSIGAQDQTIKVTLRVCYVLSFVFLALHFFAPGFLTKAPEPSTGYEHFHRDLSALGTVIPLTFLILVNLALWKLWRAYSQATGQRRTQLRYLFWASVIGYVGGSPDWCLIYRLHIPFMNPFGLYAVPCYSLATTYAVLHHRLFNVHLVVRRSLVYSFLVSTLTVGYFGLVHAVEKLFQATFGYHSIWLSLTAFALMALAFQPLKVGIQRIVDWLFFRAPHEEMVRRMERLEQEVCQVEKLKALSTFSAGLAHEIKNPLASIKIFTEHLSQRYDDPAFREKFTRIVSREVTKIDTLVRRLLDFAKPHVSQRQRVSLSQLVDETMELLQGALAQKGITLVRAFSQQDTVLVDPGQMKQVLLNVFLNSLEAMQRPGCISVSTVTDDGYLELIVTDTGPGIPRQDLRRVFDPFFTTKASGTGLGLSIVRNIVKEHCGHISIDSDLGRGATVRMQLPLAPPSERVDDPQDIKVEEVGILNDSAA